MYVTSVTVGWLQATRDTLNLARIFRCSPINRRKYQVTGHLCGTTAVVTRSAPVLRSGQLHSALEIISCLVVSRENELRSSDDFQNKIRFLIRSRESNPFQAELELTHELEPRLPNAEAEWTVINNELPNLDFDDFANVDEGVSVYGSLSDQDIIATVTSEDVLSDDDNDDGMEQPPDITTKEAKAAVNTLRSYLEQSSDVPDNVLLLTSELEDRQRLLLSAGSNPIIRNNGTPVDKEQMSSRSCSVIKLIFGTKPGKIAFLRGKPYQ
ncbi:hypothetical protein J6590_063588 [Homalodisca vitripennis]|nr:hypothetical protein J6590_063588 [Homalodisca vitripennis]